uniref:Delta9 desaturase n=1 Tax=Parietichytrium sp. TaxID=1689869 RepID=A0A809VL47_9STRA|nr:Delta9 desaturase [Parietichytrium sp.]
MAAANLQTMQNASLVDADAQAEALYASRMMGITITLAIGGVMTYFGTRQPRDDAPMRIKDMPEGYKPRDELEQKAVDSYERKQELPLIPWLMANIRWVMATYITGVHVLAVVGLPYLLDCKVETLLALPVFYIFSGFGITGGAHRLWSHKAYKGYTPYRFFVMLCNSMANQGTIYHWSRDHRTHHKYSETKADPHNALRGFFYAHVGWLLFKKDPRVKFAGAHINMSDLAALPEIKLQRRFDPWWNLFWCFGFPTLVASIGWGESPTKAYFILGVLRYVLVLNATWLVNSAAHIWGGHPYEDSHPAENPSVAILSMGEGWHNWHHAFPHDYAASELGVSAQFNPTKLFIDFCAKIGLVYERRRATEMWSTRRKNKGYKNVDLVGPPFLRQRVVS